MAEQESSSGSRVLMTIMIGGFLLLLLVALILAGYFYMQYQKTQKILQNPTLAAVQEANDLVQKVGMLIELPKGEQPTIATVSDVKKLSGDPFFANAKNGDKLLVYTAAKEAILYDPTANKIVAVGPVNVGSPTATPEVKGKVKPTPTTEPTATISAQ